MVGVVLWAGLAYGQLKEGATAVVDLTFLNPTTGLGQIPSSLTYRLDDRLSRINLLSLQTVSDPSTQPCQSGATGCVSITIPASAAKSVGECDNKEAYCLQDSDCGSGATCRIMASSNREVPLTVRWAYPGGQGAQVIVLTLQNLEF